MAPEESSPCVQRSQVLIVHRKRVHATASIHNAVSLHLGKGSPCLASGGVPEVLTHPKQLFPGLGHLQTSLKSEVRKPCDLRLDLPAKKLDRGDTSIKQ